MDLKGNAYPSQWRVTRLRVDADGGLDLDEFADAIGPDTALVSIIWANNETGVLQPLDEIARIAHDRGVWVHSDATQAVGKLPIDLRDLPVDLFSLTAHKFNGPKGIGCLVVRNGLGFDAILCGGPWSRTCTAVKTPAMAGPVTFLAASTCRQRHY